MKALSLLFLVMVFSLPAGASDLAREKRMANEIVDAILTGDPMYLEAEGHEFLAIYTEADKPKGAVIVVHGRGVHPNWPDVVYPLRTELPNVGWATLSVQMPVLAADIKADQYAPTLPASDKRLDAAMAFLKGEGYERIAIVAHSFGNLNLSHWLLNSKPEVFAYAGVGMNWNNDALNLPDVLKQLRLPVLDLYGSEDEPDIIAEAPTRAASGKASGGNYQQRVSPGADHFFRGEEADLVKTVSDWLDNLPR